MEKCKLIFGDCLDEMKKLSDNSADCIVTDPPYGIGESMKQRHKNTKNTIRWKKQAENWKGYPYNEWDKYKLTEEYFRDMFRVSRNQIIFGGNYYSNFLSPSSGWIVWDKLNGKSDFADCELAWTSFNVAVRKFEWLWHGFRKQKAEKRYHSTQKPLALMEWIVKNYSKEGDLILDPFMGSGTTGVACVKSGRRFIGIEINQEYFDIAENRIGEENKQKRLSDTA